MTSAFVARIIVTAVAAGQGITPLFVDLNRTHATNPQWPGHARFHLVQQVFTLLPVAAVETALLWYPPATRAHFYLASALTGTSLAGFLMAVLLRRFYAGTLHDPNGIQPLRFHVGSRMIAVDMNVPIVVIASLVLALAVGLFWFRG